MTLKEIMVGYPPSKDIRTHPYYRGPLSRWVWRFYHHRLARAGRWFLGITALISFVFGLFWSLDTQTYIAMLYCMAVWLVALPAFVLAPQVQIEVRHPSRVVAGTRMDVDIALTPTGKRTLPDLAIHAWGLPLAVDALDEDGTPLGSLRQGETVHVKVPLLCRQRGAHNLAGWRVDSDFPFGLLCAYRILRKPTPLIVHPAWHPLERMRLPTGRRYQPGGIALAAKTGDALEYAGSREWRHGDRPRDVDWRATARHLGSPLAPLVVREWREEYFLRVGVVLDTFLPVEPVLTPLTPRAIRRDVLARREALEQAISLCAAVSDALANQDYIVDLFAAGAELYHLTAGRGLATRDQILDILACVESTSGETLGLLAPQLTEYLERLTTLIVLATTWDEPRVRFADELRQRGVGVKVLLVIPEGTEPPSPAADLIALTRAQVAQGLGEL